MPLSQKSSLVGGFLNRRSEEQFEPDEHVTWTQDSGAFPVGSSCMSVEPKHAVVSDGVLERSQVGHVADNRDQLVTACNLNPSATGQRHIDVPSATEITSFQQLPSHHLKFYSCGDDQLQPFGAILTMQASRVGDSHDAYIRSSFDAFPVTKQS